MGKANMELSERKVEAELRKVIKELDSAIATGADGPVAARPLSDLLIAVAIAGNFDFQAAANRYQRDPGALSRLFGDEPGDEAADGAPVQDEAPVEAEAPEPAGDAAEPEPEPEPADEPAADEQ